MYGVQSSEALRDAHSRVTGGRNAPSSTSRAQTDECMRIIKRAVTYLDSTGTVRGRFGMGQNSPAFELGGSCRVLTVASARFGRAHAHHCVHLRPLTRMSCPRPDRSRVPQVYQPLHLTCLAHRCRERARVVRAR